VKIRAREGGKEEQDVRLDQHTGGDRPRAGGRVNSEVLERENEREELVSKLAREKEEIRGR